MISFLKRQKRKKLRVDAKPRTGGYRPTLPAAYFDQPRDLPLFSFSTIRHMLTDGQVRLSLAMRTAPLGQVQWEVESSNDEVAAFVQRQLDRIWQNHLTSIMQAQVWGWSAGEVTLRLTEHNLVEVNRLEARQARDCRLMVAGGTPAGVQVEGVEGDGKVNLRFPNAWFHAHEPEEGEFYGRSVLRGAYSPWFDKTCRGGAVDVRRLFMHKDAYGGVDLGYPEGFSDVLDENDEPIPYRDIAVQIVEQLRAGGVTTRPSTMDENGNEKWPLTRASVPANPQHILQYPKDLDSEIRRGIGIPDDIIDSDGSGAWAGKRVPMGAFYSSLDAWATSIAGDFREQVFDGLVTLNFGEEVDYEITHKPLAEQAMEQQSNAGGAEGGPAGQGQPGVSGGQPQQQRMSIDAVDAVGRGVLDAGRIVEAARGVLRLGAFDESKIERDEDGVLEHAVEESLAGKRMGLGARRGVRRLGPKPGDRRISEAGSEQVFNENGRWENVEAATGASSNTSSGKKKEWKHKATHSEISEMVRDVKAEGSQPAKNSFMPTAEVTPEVASKVRDATGLDVTGFAHYIETSSILKTFKDHGNEKDAYLSIQESDFEILPQVLRAPDEVLDAGATDQGLPAVMFKKRFNGRIIVVEEVRAGKKRLALKTMYKQRSKK